METITPLGSGRGLPDVSVAEFAIMIALMRLGPQPAPGLLPTLSDWFGHSLSLSDIRPALRRLEHQGYIVAQDDGLLQMKAAAAEPVSLSFMALIRIVGTEFGRALKSADPQLLVGVLKKSAEDEAVEAEESLRKRQGKRMMTDAQREEIRERERRNAREERLRAAKAKAEAERSARTTRQSKRKGKGPASPKDSSEE